MELNNAIVDIETTRMAHREKNKVGSLNVFVFCLKILRMFLSEIRQEVWIGRAQSWSKERRI